jgi:hypothetical protein
MDEQSKQSLLAKREEGVTKLKQAESDLYYLQGYLKAIEDLIAESEAKDEDKVSD